MNETLYKAGGDIRDFNRKLSSIIEDISRLEHYIIMLEEDPIIFINNNANSLNIMMGDDMDQLIKYINQNLTRKLDNCYKDIRNLVQNIEYIGLSESEKMFIRGD